MFEEVWEKVIDGSLNEAIVDVCGKSAVDRGTAYFLLSRMPMAKGKCGARLEFWVGPNVYNHDRICQLLDDCIAKGERKYLGVSYYNSRGLKCWRPILDEKNLQEDLQVLQADLKPLLQELTDNEGRSAHNSPLVGITALSVRQIFKLGTLRIPDYQRPYTWERSNIVTLLNDIRHWQKFHEKDRIFHIGTIILKKRKDGYDIIDGQQRIMTLGLYALEQGGSVEMILGSSNASRSAMDRLVQARETIRSWGKKEAGELIDLDRVRLSVICIQEEAPEDLAFSFFNHVNSMGKPLTDYDLLKSHHLRFVSAPDSKADDAVAEVMARRWHDLEPMKHLLLHNCLYRIRKWLEGVWFPPSADVGEDHLLFREFSMHFEPERGLCTASLPPEIDSILSSGREFFDYVERFRNALENFQSESHRSIKSLEVLKWHSHGTLYWGIFALSFMFYCKFGDIYLDRAVVAIAEVVSVIRTQTRIERSEISNRIFSQIARIIARVTHEGEFFGLLREDVFSYDRTDNVGPTANAYWTALNKVVKPENDK